jgi:hypothetical protein
MVTRISVYRPLSVSLEASKSIDGEQAAVAATLPACMLGNHARRQIISVMVLKNTILMPRAWSITAK